MSIIGDRPGAEQERVAADAAGDHHRQRLADGAACLAAALQYRREYDWHVLSLCPPDHAGVGLVSRTHSRTCRTPGKRPWHTWRQYQTEVPAEADVRDWWRQLPTANVGMALGRVLRIDTDGPAGEELLGSWSGGDLPATLEFTGDATKGGRGLLYLAPPGVALRSTSELPQDGQELRLQGLGAQTVLPPSRHPRGMLYAWRPGHGPGEMGLAPAPAWLVRRLQARAPRPRPAPATGSPGQAADQGSVAMALQALARLSPDRAVGYDSWLHTGMALHSVDPSDEMLAAWDEWSAQCAEKYADGACPTKWATFDGGEGGYQLADLLR